MFFSSVISINIIIIAYTYTADSPAGARVPADQLPDTHKGRDHHYTIWKQRIQLQGVPWYRMDQQIQLWLSALKTIDSGISTIHRYQLRTLMISRDSSCIIYVILLMQVMDCKPADGISIVDADLATDITEPEAVTPNAVSCLIVWMYEYHPILLIICFQCMMITVYPIFMD